MVVNRINQAARAAPGKTAVIHNDVAFSYAAFAGAIEASRAIFARENLPRGATAIVSDLNLLQTWIASFGARLNGLDAICYRELARNARLSVRNVCCVVMSEAEAATRSHRDPFFRRARVVVLPDALTQPGVDSAPWPAPQPSGAPFGGQIIYSSGSTGSYKQMLAAGPLDDARNERWGKMLILDQHTVFQGIDAFPWFSGGFGIPSAVWSVGGCVIFDDRPGAISRFFGHAPTHSFLPTLLVKAFVRTYYDNPPSNRDFELASGGGPLPLSVARAARKLTNKLFNRYGSSECPIVARTQIEHDDDVFWNRAVPDRTIEIVDQHGHACADGEEGDLRIRLLATDCTSYLDDQQATQRFFRDGYFYPGDMAVRRADGRVRILGRSTDVLNVQGYKKPAAPLEEKAQQMLGIDTVCLFSHQSDEGSDELIVALETATMPAQDKRERFVVQILGFEKINFEILREFPRMPDGLRKVNRHELRRLLQERARKRR